MKTLDAPTLAALATPGRAVAQLVELDLDTPWFVNTSGWDLIWNGNTYLGTRGAGRIEEIEDTPAEIRGLTFSLPAIIDADLATALIGMPMGRGARLYTAIFDPTTCRIITAELDWAGRLDVPQIGENVGADRKGTSGIQVSAEHSAIELMRPSGLLYSNADQQRLYPGDRSFEYVVDQSEAEIIWPAASFFKK